MAIMFALICLGFTAINDLVFKFYARKSRARGLYVMIIGVVWMLLFLAGMRFDPSPWRITLAWGVVSGLFSVGANLLLIEAMTYQEAGVCATVYRLNMVAVIVGAVLLLGERIGPLKLCGIVLAIVAVLFFARNHDAGTHSAAERRLGLLLVGVAALLRAGMGLSYKCAFLHGADANSITLINSICWIAGGWIYTLWRERGVGGWGVKPWTYGLTSGLLVGGIVFFMAASLRYGDAGIVLPIAQMSFLITALLGVLILKESLSRRKILGIAAGLSGILLLSLC